MKTRCIGVETEFGVHLHGHEFAPPGNISRLLVTNLVPARQLIDSEWINNGGRIYVDLEHLEYSAPEATDYLTAAKYELAGIEIMADICRRAIPLFKKMLGGGRVSIYKNNTDAAGNCYGCHENYQVFAHNIYPIVTILEPFFVTRHIWCGAGDLVMDKIPRFEISQRARSTIEFIQMYAKPDEKPYIKHRQGDDYCTNSRRVEVVGGDSNIAHAVIALKLGITSLMFELAESGYLAEPPVKLDRPIEALRESSRSPFQTLHTAEYDTIRAAEVQRAYLEQAAGYFSGDPVAERLIAELAGILDLLDMRSPKLLIGKTEWATKLHMLKRFTRPVSAAFRDCENITELKARDLSCHDVSDGLFKRCHDTGVFKRLFTDAEIKQACKYPPKSRALTRRRIMEMAALGEVSLGDGKVDWEKAKVLRLDGSIYDLFFGEPHEDLTKNTMRQLVRENAVLKRPHRIGTQTRRQRKTP